MARGMLLAGTHSGVGKTTVSLGLMGFLSRSFRVLPFKVGPDYIDPGYHRLVCGREGYNLDLFLLGQNKVEELFRRRANTADIAILEGVMGLFDGLGADGFGSSAQIAKILSLPVLLVVDARGMAQSVSALVRGFRNFDPEVRFLGVFLNRIRNDRHLRLLRECVERDTGLPVLGFLPDDADLVLPERHLGLVPAVEVGERDRLERIVELIAGNCDWEMLLRMMPDVPPLPRQETTVSCPIRVGMALDAAFHFSYRSSLETLKEAGVELVPFSPLADEKLPEGIKGLYLPGGFPEVFASDLSANDPLRKAIWRAATFGMPIYAECGGLMYLSRELRTGCGVFTMVGVFDFSVEMTSRLQRFGYAQATVVSQNLLANPGMVLRGHEFHYSRVMGGDGQTTYWVEKPDGSERWECGFVKHRVLATYLHIDFFAFPEAAQKFVTACRDFEIREDNDGSPAHRGSWQSSS
jgi:cobyrinic acid a,c-diamide synthase